MHRIQVKDLRPGDLFFDQLDPVDLLSTCVSNVRYVDSSCVQLGQPTYVCHLRLLSARCRLHECFWGENIEVQVP